MIDYLLIMRHQTAAVHILGASKVSYLSTLSALKISFPAEGHTCDLRDDHILTLLLQTALQTTLKLACFALQTNFFRNDRSNRHDWQAPNLVEDESIGNIEKKSAPCIRMMKSSRYFGEITLGENIVWDS